jgi:hypothetical protein
MDNLKKYLAKLGVTEFSHLSEEEKETYRKWDEVLSGRKLTDDDVKDFLDRELDDIQVRIVSPNLSVREDLFLKMNLEFIRKVKVFLMSPITEKKVLEQNINNLIQQ